LIAALIAVLVISGIVLTSKITLSDRLAEAADIIAGGSAFLGVLAGFVALQAYAVTTGLPNLKVQVWFTASSKNVPVFRVREVSRGILETVNPPTQTTAIISLRNESFYSARDPVVVVTLSPVTYGARAEFPHSDGWTSFRLPDESLGSREIIAQWNGAAGSIIHGRAFLRLPELQFGTLSYNQSWQPLRIQVDIIADGGYRRYADLAVTLLGDSSSDRDSKSITAPDWL
jgi:hypothetical protein